MDICKLAVLSGCEIDRAKREFVINSTTEINILKRKYKITDDAKTVKPRFFKMICLENGYQLSDNIKYKDFRTSMDYLQKCIARFNFRESRKFKEKPIPFMSIVKEPPPSTNQGYYYHCRDEIIDLIRKTRETIRRLYVGYDERPLDEKEDIRILASEIRQDCTDEIHKMGESPSTMYLTLKELDNPKNKDISRFVFDVLFGKPNEAFYGMIRESREAVYTLEEDPDGALEYYGIRFSRVKIQTSRPPST